MARPTYLDTDQPWKPSNERLAKLTGLPNLDTITDIKRLRSLRDMALRKLASRLHQNGHPRCYAMSAGLYAVRAAEKSLA